ncbi:hypothetical protein Avbf_07074 [Armadillidium vulgare]|nr:hypothetical protein Avbf_07074 [Armadillidium vulgare]
MHLSLLGHIIHDINYLVCAYHYHRRVKNTLNFSKAKRDNITKTGKGGMGKYTEVDELVLDILGKESPLICGLGVRESMASTECASSVIVDVNEDPEKTDDCPEPVPHQSSQHVF